MFVHSQINANFENPKKSSYHVWLRGSQFSLPTFSMQNFWGPLLPMKETNKNAGHEGRKLVTGFAQVCVCVPIRSAKPPTGRRQVPVTNCSSLILFSLSISFTNWPKVLCKISHHQGHLFTFQSWKIKEKQILKQCNTAQIRGNYRKAYISEWEWPSDQTLPARTRGSVYCFEHSVCKWCFSASRPGRSPASHTALPTSQEAL